MIGALSGDATRWSHKSGDHLKRLAVFATLALVAAAAGPAAAADLDVSDCTIVGDDGPHTLNGTDSHDIICGLGGNDNIDGGPGDDVIWGGPVGGEGHDHEGIIWPVLRLRVQSQSSPAFGPCGVG